MARALRLLACAAWMLVARGDASVADGPARDEERSRAFYALAGAAPDALPAEGIFPRGRTLAYWGYSGDPARDLAQGFTVAGPVYGDQGPSLARCFEHGWPVVAHVGLPITFNDKARNKYRLDETALREAVAKQVRALATHKEIVWWAVTPEELRPWRGDEMRYLGIVVDTVRDTDPLHRPIYLYNPNHRDAGSLSPIARHVDVVAKGCYVNLVGRKRDRGWVRWSIEQELEAIRRSGRPEAIALVMPELCRDPEAAEDADIPRWVRHDVYLGLVSGAKGVGIWSLFRRREVHRTWQRWYDAYAECGRELNGDPGLAQVFLFGERRHDLTVRPAMEGAGDGVPLGGNAEPETTSDAERVTRVVKLPSWTTAEFAYGVSRYVFLVNSANEAASFMLSGWPSGSVAVDAVTSQAIDLPDEGPLSIDLAPCGVATIRLSAAGPRPTSSRGRPQRPRLLGITVAGASADR